MASSRDYIMPNGLRKIVFPFRAGPGGIEQPPPSHAVVYNQTYPATIWTIKHHLGYNPSVSVIIANQEVDTDVDYPDTNTVVITFQAPQQGSARLT